MKDMHDNLRRDAINDAKQAVRIYARDPSKANAQTVEEAWRRLRMIDDVDAWRGRNTGYRGTAVGSDGTLQ